MCAARSISSRRPWPPNSQGKMLVSHAPPPIGGVTANRRSEHPVRRQVRDLAFRHPEHRALGIPVVLAVARRAAVDAAAREGGALAQFDRPLGDRPAADLRAGHLGEPLKVSELRIVIAAVLRPLPNAGRYAC